VCPESALVCVLV